MKINTGKTAPRMDYTNEGVRILKVKNIRGVGIDWLPEFYVTQEFFEKAKKAHLQKNDILMLCSAHNKSYIGRCDIIDKNLDNALMCVGELIIIRPDPAKIIPEFLLEYLRLDATENQIQWMVTGQTAHLYPKDLANLKIVVPPLELQEKIASIGVMAEKQYLETINKAKHDLSNARQTILELIKGGVS